MTAFYDLERANARLPELRETLESLRLRRSELIDMRDRIVGLVTRAATATAAGSGTSEEAVAETAARLADAEREAQQLHMRMQGVVDQMEAAVGRINAWGIELRDIPTGLVDFPALAAGRQVWLCWRLGEERVGWWHEMSDGFEGRRRIEDLA
jgi:hypothetical protein